LDVVEMCVGCVAMASVLIVAADGNAVTASAAAGIVAAVPAEFGVGVVVDDAETCAGAVV